MARRTWTVLGLLTLALALAVPAGASAAAWVGQATITELPVRNTAPPSPQLRVDGAGNAVMAMAVAKGPPFFVQVASRPAGAGWSAVQELGQASQSPASLAIDPSGTALVAFVSTTTTTAPCTNGNACLQIWIKPPGVSTWSQEKLVAGPAATAFFEPSVALDPNSTGNAAVVWNTTPTVGQSAVQAIQRTAGVWGVVQSVNSSNTETYDRTRVAIDSAGTPIALWASSLNTCPTTCSYQLRTAAFTRAWANTSFETNATEKFDSATGDLFERLDGQGTVSAIWIRTNATTGAQTIRSATHPLTGTAAWGSASTVETLPAGSTAFDPRLAIASDGEAVSTWGEQAAGGAVAILSSVRPPGGSFPAPTTLDSGTNVNAGPDLAMDGQGTATVAWRNAAGGTQRFAVHAHGGSFGGTFDAFTGTGSGRTIADADPAGHVSAVWAASTSTVQTQVYDPVPPVMPALASPLATTPTNTLVSFDTSATDVWSNPVSIHWDFGDGASADGASATHAYALPGVFTPKAVATDASGNSAAQTSQIQATAPPSGPAALPRPVAGQSVNLEPVGGTVLVRVPGSSNFVPLVTPTQVRNGSIIDARKGRVRITIDNGRGGLDTSDFYGGIFEFTQPKVKAGQTWFADLFLFGGSFKGCPKAPANPKLASVSGGKKNAHRSVRHLWGSGHGAFRTVGRFSSATVRGTTWLTDDRCDGTLTKVTSGKVGVRDFVTGRTVVVKARKTYFASPRPAKKR